MRISVLSIIICFVLLSTSCREDERIIPSTPNQVTPGVSVTSVKGFFYNRQIKKFPTEKQNVSLKHILT